MEKASSCATCGMLGVRHPVSKLLVEADEATRQTGCFKTMGPGTYSIGDHVTHTTEYASPFCTMLEPAFLDESRAAKNEIEQLEVLHRPRDCKSSCRWLPGMSPKDYHDAMTRDYYEKLAEDRLLKDRNWREAVDAKNREWEAKQDAERQKWEAEQNRMLAKIGAINTLAGALVGAIVAAVLAWFLSPRNDKPVVVTFEKPIPIEMPKE